MKRFETIAEICNHIDQRVLGAVRPTPYPLHVHYAAIKGDREGYIDNLDDVPHKGPCRLLFDGAPWGGGEYVSEVLDSPTWLEIAVKANEAIAVTGTNRRLYLTRYETQLKNTLPGVADLMLIMEA